MQYWLVTFVTHNSRTSQRMVYYNIKTGEPVLFIREERILMKRLIKEAIDRHQMQVLELAVLPDHVHLVIKAETEDALNAMIKNIKGATSYQYKKAFGWATKQQIWARKFNRRVIEDEKALAKARHYVRFNYQKHQEQWGDELDNELNTAE